MSKVDKVFGKNKSQGSPIDCVWALICSGSVTDKQTNNITIYNVIEQFNLPSIYFKQKAVVNRPTIVPVPYEIIIYWRRKLNVAISSEEIRGEVKIVTVYQGKNLMEMMSPFVFPDGKQNLRFRIVPPGLAVKSPGNYVNKIEVRFSGEPHFMEVLQIPFSVTETL